VIVGCFAVPSKCEFVRQECSRKVPQRHSECAFSQSKSCGSPRKKFIDSENNDKNELILQRGVLTASSS
jgi:hypothetical protein